MESLRPHGAARGKNQRTAGAHDRLVWPKEQRLSTLVQEFLNYVSDFMEEDRIHTKRFQVKEHEFQIPEGAEIL